MAGNPKGNPQNLIPAKPGEIRNPKGKPKGTKNWSTIYTKVLKTKVNLKEHPLTKKPGARLTVREMIALSMVKEATQGNVAAAKEIADREEGKVPQKLTGGDAPTGGGIMILRWIGEGEDYPPLESEPQNELSS